MQFPIPSQRPIPSGHAGYVAGRYRDGAYSDVWTDVSRCAVGTFTAFAPACRCGWRGPAWPVSDVAALACRRAWLQEHIPLVLPAFDADADAAASDLSKRIPAQR